MLLLYSLFFGAGIGAFVYTKMGRRLGYQNSQNVWTVVGVGFVIGFLFFYTFFKFVLNFK